MPSRRSSLGPYALSRKFATSGGRGKAGCRARPPPRRGPRRLVAGACAGAPSRLHGPFLGVALGSRFAASAWTPSPAALFSETNALARFL